MAEHEIYTEFAPSNFRHWTGAARSMKDIEWRDATWPNVLSGYFGPDGEWAMTLPRSPHWQHLGWTPKPRTRWRAFWYHWHHGRLMRYPRLSVLVYAVRFSRRVKA